MFAAGPRLVDETHQTASASGNGPSQLTESARVGPLTICLIPKAQLSKSHHLTRSLTQPVLAVYGR
jgi:hypothetical protein